MRWLDSLERRFGHWSIPHFPLFIAAANGTIYLLTMSQPGFVDRLRLIPDAVFHGEWWRLVTFIFIPPTEWHFLLVALWLYALYSWSQAIESEWGEFRFCFFYLFGAFLTAIAALFIAHGSGSNIWLNNMIFMAFASLFPEAQVLLFFFIPMKVKYLGWFYWVVMAWYFLVGYYSERVAIAASVLNLGIFIGPQLVTNARQWWEVRRNRRRFHSPPEN